MACYHRKDTCSLGRFFRRKPGAEPRRPPQFKKLPSASAPCSAAASACDARVSLQTAGSCEFKGFGLRKAYAEEVAEAERPWQRGRQRLRRPRVPAQQNQLAVNTNAAQSMDEGATRKSFPNLLIAQAGVSFCQIEGFVVFLYGACLGNVLSARLMAEA